MRALILAAGEGTRLRPLTIDRPKPMLPIGGVPLLEHLVNHLAAHGIREIAINLHYRPQAIVDHFGDGARFGVQITYSHEERLLGSAGAAKRLEAYFQDTFVVLYGDVLTDIDLTALVDYHREKRAIATLALYEAEDPTRCGIVAVDPSGRVTRFVEKPPADQVFSTLANAGIYVLEPAVLQYVAPDQPADFGQEIFSRLIEAGCPVYAKLADAYVLDIGSVERYEQAERDLAAGRISGLGTGQGVLGLSQERR